MRSPRKKRSSGSADKASEAVAEADVTGEATTKKLSGEDIDTAAAALFEEGNELVTAVGGSLPVKDDTRSLLALFSNGRFLVSETHKFDGRVLSFEVLARKRRLQVGKPEYVPMNMITAIYDHAEKKLAAGGGSIGGDDDQDQMQMQRDLITVISRAAANNVSDIHVVVAEHTTIYFRTNGMMQTEMEYNREWGESFVRAAFASADISDSNYAQNEYQGAQKDGQTPLRGSKGRLMLPKNVLGVRLQFNPVAFGSQYLVMRVLYADADAENTGDLTSLGYTEMEAEMFYRMRAMPTGLCIVAGPTGSGKSTTLQRNMISLLQDKNYEVNLITVEDPPEYPIPGARQMPVTNANTEAEKDEQFTKALSAALRSDPDILMVGEIRTLSAAQLTFKGALSGHGVWTTIHANSSPAILMRLRDMGVEDFKVSDPELVKGLISQRLFRRVCPHCRIPVTEKPEHPAFGRLKRALGDFGLEQSYLRGPGCKHCDYKGISGRVVVGEIIIPDGTFLKLMVEGEVRKAIVYWTGDLNGRTIRDASVERMLRGALDVEEVERWCGLLDERPVY